jgi:radical SAM superfamily enzyme YgiQ (UPF0313 family)
LPVASYDRSGPLKDTVAFVRLVNLSSLPVLGNRPVYPVGLVSIAEAVRAAGHEVEIVDFVAHPERIESLSWLNEPCDIVGFAIRDVDPIDIARFSFVHAFTAFAARVRSRTEELGYRPTFVGGGTGFTLFPQALGSLLGVDVVVSGQGEGVLSDLCASGRASAATAVSVLSAPDPGFASRVLNHPPSLVSAYLRAGYTEIGVETRRRKCLRRCQYCPYAFINEGTLGELKPIDSLRQSVDRLYSLGVRHLFFTDAVFNNELVQAKRVCQMLAEARYPELKWSAYFVPSGFDQELAELVASSGNLRVIFSPDSFDPRMLRISGKGFGIHSVLKAKRICEVVGLKSAWMLLFGSAHEDRETIRRSGEFANEHFQRHEVSIHVGIRLLPGSPLVRQLGLSDAELLFPVFYPIDPRVFDWILEDFDERFFTGESLLRLRSMQASLGRLSHRPINNAINTGLDYLLVQEREVRLAYRR